MLNNKLATQLLMFFFLCVLLESVSWFLMRKKKDDLGFLIRLKNEKKMPQNNYDEVGLDKVDPLLGWSWSNQSFLSKGYDTSHNCLALYSKCALPIKPVKIFITGGSTSDITLKSPNWVNELQSLLKANNINAIIYCGAVCGYNSGQELLKLLRDGMMIEPDIHISYSGANDFASNVGYVSDYEKNIYNSFFEQKNISPLLPNTIYMLRLLLPQKKTILSFENTSPPRSDSFWYNNMLAMGGIATKKNYAFMGILQPVLGMGHYRQHNAEAVLDSGRIGRKANYGEYYPKAKQHIASDTLHFFDFTHIFDTVRGEVFVDFCHIDDDYQKTVAENVFVCMVKQNYIVPNTTQP